MRPFNLFQESCQLFKKIILIVFPLFFLGGCAALPAFVSYVGYTQTAANGVSYVASKKSMTDHAISAAKKKDCAMHRALFKEDICVDFKKKKRPEKDVVALRKWDGDEENSQPFIESVY